MSKKYKPLIVLTRPVERIESAASHFKRSGLTVLNVPLVECRAALSQSTIVERIKTLKDYSTIILVSPAAVKYLFQLYPDFSPMPEHVIIAVGPATAKLWQEKSKHPVLVPDQYHSGGIIALLKQYDNSLQVAILAAPGGRRSIMYYCIKNQISYQVIYLYERVFLTVESAIYKKIAESDQFITTFTSRALLKHFFTGLVEPYKSIITSRPVVCGSEKIAQEAFNMGFVKIVTADSPDNDKMCSTVWQCVTENQ